MLVVLLEHVAHLCLDELRKPLLHVGRYFSTVLPVAISNGKEVAVLETTKVRNRDPGVLVRLMGIG